MRELDEALEKIKYMFDANALDIALKEAERVVGMIKRIKKQKKN